MSTLKSIIVTPVYVFTIFATVITLEHCKTKKEYQKEVSKIEKTDLENSQQTKVDSHSKAVTGLFVSVLSDIKNMATDDALLHLLDKPGSFDREQVEHNYLAIVNNKKIYDQLRLINEKGMEVARVNYNSGSPFVVPNGRLQSKADRYYFKGAFMLERGQVYVSPFDLNVERGEIEQPPKPTIRFAIPVFDSSGEKQGIVILNYLGAILLDNFERVAVNFKGESMLLNSDGFWLYSLKKDREFAFMYENKKSLVFRNTYPEAWRKISESKSGQFDINNRLFTFNTVYPFPQTNSRDRFWKIVSLISVKN